MLQGHFMGGFRLVVDDVDIDGLTTRKSRSLLAYLMLNPGRTFGRQLLAETIWGNGSSGDIMKALRQELWIIRRAFRDADIDPETHLSLESEELGVKDTPWVDASTFEATIEPHINPPDKTPDNATVTALEAAIALYGGDLLPGLYDDWCLFPREILRDKYIIAVERLMEWHAGPGRENWGAALLYGRRLLDVDPLLEHVHRDMMRYHYARGDRPAALRQYGVCKQRLRRDLTIDPMAETTVLYEAIRQENDAEIIKRAVAGREARERAARQRAASERSSPASLSALDAIRNDLNAAGRRIEAMMRAERK